MVRLGVRLRWVGDGTDRLRIRDVWALVNSLLGDETSALFRARNPEYTPAAERFAMDTVNALLLLNLTVRRAAGDKSAPRTFEAPYQYPGSMWKKPERASLMDASARLGGYRAGSRSDITAWLRSRGLPTPKPPPSPTDRWLDKLPAGQLSDGQLVDRIDRL